MAARPSCATQLGLEAPSGRVRLGARNEIAITRKGQLPKTKREIPGNDLLSHPVARAVPSALVGLTAVFGMGTGVSPPLWSPDISDLKGISRSLRGPDERGSLATGESSSCARHVRARRRLVTPIH